MKAASFAAAVDRSEAVMDLAKRRGFLWPAYDAYGGLAGFYDYGPLGAAMKARFEDLWRHVFQRAEPLPMAEIACPRVTPFEVLKASGHVDEFTDLVVKCANGHPQRADHLVEGAGYEGNADALPAAAIDAELARLAPKCPVCGDKAWSTAAPMNLMNQTEIGPGSARVGFLRPETAQGIFVDFPFLLRHFRGRLPFGVTQIGGSNRNEISPRQGMLRLREFHMMEAEVFFEDTSTPFPAFEDVRDEDASFVPNDRSKPVRLTFGEAVDEGIVANEALAYFLARTQEFLLLAGIDPERLRFRQHLKDEMAHYASDCWDAEFLSDRYGWVECVGVADRGCYDLTQHAEASGHPADFQTTIEFPEPIEVDATRLEPVMGVLGKTFRAEAKRVAALMEARFQADMDPEALGLSGTASPDLVIVEPKETTPADGPVTLTDGEAVFEVPADGYRLRRGTWRIIGKRLVPRVIEPSFGVDRILYALWEHAYERAEKEGEPYVRLRLSPHVAPVQVAVLPLMSKDGLPELADEVEWMLREAGFRTDSDASGNIGRRYARQDEVGTPFCVTADTDTLRDGTVTVRDRDTTDQVRVPIEALVAHLGTRFALPGHPGRRVAAST